MKPPLGLVPEFIWKEQRYKDIVSAMIRYTEAGKQIPLDWRSQAEELKAWIADRDFKSKLNEVKNDLLKADAMLKKECNEMTMEFYKKCILAVDKAERYCK